MKRGTLRRGAVFAIILLAVTGCGRGKPVSLIPPEDVLALYLQGEERLRAGVLDFEASGRMSITQRGFTVRAEERFLYKYPDRARLLVRTGGFFGFGRAEYDILARGDSIYVTVGPDGWSWGGTRREVGWIWGDEGRLLLAAMEEATPGAARACGTPLRPAERLPDGEVPEGSVGGSCEAGPYTRFIWVDPRDLRPEECRFYDGSSLVGRARYEDYRSVGDFARPARIEIAFPRESMGVVVEHEVQRVNRGLEDGAFDPVTRGWEGS